MEELKPKDKYEALSELFGFKITEEDEPYLYLLQGIEVGDGYCYLG